MSHSAPVYAIADEQRARAEAAAWARFTSEGDSVAGLSAWLALLAGRIGRARAALLLTRQAQDAAFTVAAVWPEAQRDLQYLSGAAQRALDSREAVVAAPGGHELPAGDSAAHVAYPISMDGQLCAAVVFDIGAGPRDELQAALRQIHWGAAWVIDHFRRELLAARNAEMARIDLLNETLATAMQHALLEPSALAVANELAQRLRCDRVSVGFEKHGQVVPLVMSNTASFDRRSDLVRWIGEAMDEALDLGVSLAHPAPEDEPLSALAQAESARQLSVQALLSVPVRDQGRTIGAISLERMAGPPFTADERQLAEALGVLLGPYWGIQRERERGLLERLREDTRSGLRRLGGASHPGLKLIAVLLAVGVAALALWTIDYRVSARTVVEGSVQIAAVAPFDGYVAEAPVRAGDRVRAGQTLVRLDERDLKLERTRWLGERGQLQRKYEVAQAQGDRATMGVLAAQVNQADAQLALAEERLARATLAAPFDGIVVSGDLSQQIGSPVETGRVLFEVAPLEGFRVMMQVDDRDIARLDLGQSGELVLSGLPDRKLPIKVKRITPVAAQHDGRNVFVVEASVEPGAVTSGVALRPGMEGIAKVVVGQRSLLWIWTHPLIDWLRLTLWSWLP